jgi:hypothetical protein
MAGRCILICRDDSINSPAVDALKYPDANKPCRLDAAQRFDRLRNCRPPACPPPRLGKITTCTLESP